jgi:hypothetical protein
MLTVIYSLCPPVGIRVDNFGRHLVDSSPLRITLEFGHFIFELQDPGLQLFNFHPVLYIAFCLRNQLVRNLHTETETVQETNESRILTDGQKNVFCEWWWQINQVSELHEEKVVVVVNMGFGFASKSCFGRWLLLLSTHTCACL